MTNPSWLAPVRFDSDDEWWDVVSDMDRDDYSALRNGLQIRENPPACVLWPCPVT